MLRAHREPMKAERHQLLADRALVQNHAELRLDAAHILAMPAHYPVLLWVGSGLDPASKLCHLLWSEPAGAARDAAVSKPDQPLGVVAQDSARSGLNSIHQTGIPSALHPNRAASGDPSHKSGPWSCDPYPPAQSRSPASAAMPPHLSFTLSPSAVLATSTPSA